MVLFKSCNHRFVLSAITVISLSFFTACVQGNSGCLLYLANKEIKIVDQNGEPVSGVMLNITNTRTGKRLCSTAESDEKRKSCEEELGELGDTGQYVIVTSLNTAENSIGDVREGDVLSVSGTKGQANFTEDYMVMLDPSGCHPQKIQGPDKVVLSLN